MWRWDEQWLPHSTWYLMAVAVRYDEIKVKIPALPEPPPVDSTDADSSKTNPGNDDAIPGVKKLQPHLDVAVNGNVIHVALSGRVGEMVQVFDLSGKCVRKEKLVGHSVTIRMPENQSGIYFVKVGKFGIRKIVIR